MIGNLNHGQLPNPIRNPSFRAKRADAFSALPPLRKVGPRREKSLFASFSSFVDLRPFKLNLLLCSALLALTFSLNAQAPTAVPIPKEPHHHLVLENDYVRVFRVSVPAHESTLLHQHDVPYVYVALGPADVINAVQGKPEVRLVMANEQVGYSRGGFAHIARTDSGLVFNNVTVELLMPQSASRNLCTQVVQSDIPGPCEKISADNRKGYSIVPQFETGETRVDLVRLDPRAKQIGISSQVSSLLIALNDSQFEVKEIGKPSRVLNGGEVIWIEAGSKETLSNPAKKVSSYLQLVFKDLRVGVKP